MVKNVSANAEDTGGFIPGLGRCLGRCPFQYFLPGEFHGQRSLVGYSLQGHKESDMTEN